MANLPLELVNEILLWLPVKSLLRFRCGSKSFYALIESQSFINSHLKRSSENRINHKLIELGAYRMDNGPPEIHAFAFNDDFEQELVLEKPIISELYNFFISYCNGLVLLCINKLSIWNPSTRKYRILPDIPVEIAGGDLSFGLGYDSTADDYKAVVIISKKGWDTAQVWIFELRSSSWRRIQDFPYVEYNDIENGGNGDCFVDGALHFICHHDITYKSHIIVAFDVAKETFFIVHESVDPTKVFPIRLSVLGGCLSIISIGDWDSTPEDQIDIYVRKKEGVEFTWTRLYFVTRQQFSEEAFGYCFTDGRVAYSKEGDKVFLNSNGKLCSYDLKDKTLQEIVTNSGYLHIFSCTETLASVGS